MIMTQNDADLKGHKYQAEVSCMDSILSSSALLEKVRLKELH